MRPGARAIALLTTAVLGCTVSGGALSGCAAATDPVRSSVSSSTSPTSASSESGTTDAGPKESAPLASGPPASGVVGARAVEVALVQEAIDRFNATAGGSVEMQQALLSGLVSAAQATQQQACPRVTVTISMEPVYARLAASPGWRPNSGSLPGTVYAVPTLIRIYTGDRITGTDLTDLHLAIDDGRMVLPAVCLR